MENETAKIHIFYGGDMVKEVKRDFLATKRESREVSKKDCQHVPLIIKWPGSDNMSVAVNKLSSPFDLPATVATEILQVTTDPADYSLGENLKELSDRRFIVSDEPEIILIGSKDTTVYSDEGSALIEDNGKALRIRPNLENLIRAMRTLNRFKE